MPIKVKELSWKEIDYNHFKQWHAHVVFGKYMIWVFDGKYRWMLHGSGNVHTVKSKEAAIAAAQKDYDRKILELVYEG